MSSRRIVAGIITECHHEHLLLREEESLSNIWSSNIILYMSSVIVIFIMGSVKFSAKPLVTAFWWFRNKTYNLNLTLRELWQMLWSFFLQFYVVFFSVMNVWRRWINRMTTVFFFSLSVWLLTVCNALVQTQTG